MGYVQTSAVYEVRQAELGWMWCSRRVRSGRRAEEPAVPVQGRRIHVAGQEVRRRVLLAPGQEVAETASRTIW